MRVSLAKKWCLLVILFVVLPALAPAQQLEPVIMGVVGLSTNSIHPFISREAGLFSKYGIDARLVVFDGGSTLAQAAISGEVKFANTSGPVSISSRSAGADRIIVAAHINILPYSLIAAKGITRWEQLKGKRIAISRFGSGTDTAVRLVLEKFGLNPDKDVTILQLGPQTTRFSALVSGSTDATLVAPPFDVTAKKQGYLGRSLGCPALRPEVSKKVIDVVKGGDLIFAYYPDPQWLESSKYLGDCASAAE